MDDSFIEFRIQYRILSRSGEVVLSYFRGHKTGMESLATTLSDETTLAPLAFELGDFAIVRAALSRSLYHANNPSGATILVNTSYHYIIHKSIAY